MRTVFDIPPTPSHTTRGRNPVGCPPHTRVPADGACDTEREERILPSFESGRQRHTDPGVSLALARDRADRLNTLRYALQLTLPSDPAAPVTGALSITCSLSGADAPLVLDFAPGASGSVARLAVNGVQIEPHLVHGHLVLPPERLVDGTNTIDVVFTAGNGPLNRRADHLYTIFVPARAHEAIPCFDQPDLKGVWSLTLDVPSAWTAVANGRAEARTEHIDESGATRARVAFTDTAPLPTYLVAFAAGALTECVFVRRDRAMRVYHVGLDPRLVEANLDVIVDSHIDALRWMEDYTDIPYPFGKLDIVLLPAFQFGGMEHPGAIFYNASVVLLTESATRQQLLARAHVIAHETAHMWFGNLVTMRWFDDVWMKEVFANAMAAKIVCPQFRELDHDLQFLQAHYPAAYDVDRTDGRHPIRQSLDNLADAGSLYGALIYLKSPIVMRQLERMMGRDAMRDALRAYLTTFRFGNAAWPDLLAIFAAHTAIDLRAWSHDWLEEAGRPRIRVERSGADDSSVTLTTVGEHSSRARWPQQLELALGRDGTVQHIALTLDGHATLPLTREPAAADFILPNGRGLGYGNIVLDAQSRAWLLEHLPEVPDALTRGSAWLTLWDGMLDDAVPPRALLALARRALSAESSELNLQRLLACIERLVWTFLTDAERAETAPALETALRARLERAESTSLAAACFACLRSTATTAATVQWLQQLWAGEASLPGLPLGEAELIALTCDLAVRHVDGDALVAAQVARTVAPDRRAALAFVAPALSSDAATRESFFTTISDAAHRRREPWVVDGLRWLHHPLHAAHAQPWIGPGLDLLEEVRRTGDIFLPKRWLDAVLSGHRSAAAAATVRRFLATRPAGYPPALTRMILASADLLFRAARREA